MSSSLDESASSVEDQEKESDPEEQIDSEKFNVDTPNNDNAKENCEHVEETSNEAVLTWKDLVGCFNVKFIFKKMNEKFY